VPTGSNIIQAVATATNLPAASLVWNTVQNVLFSFLVYLTSIPVAMIIVQLNLVSSRLCSKRILFFFLIIAVASFFGVTAPFLAAIPMLTGTWNEKFRKLSMINEIRNVDKYRFPSSMQFYPALPYLSLSFKT
jgi:hypothetical protein